MYNTTCLSAYVGQISRLFVRRMAEYKRAVRRQDKSGFLALQCLKPGLGLDKGRTAVVDSTKRKRDILGACVNQCTTTDLCYKAWQEYWKCIGT